MAERKNAGYTIVQSLMIGNTEFVIGHHPTAPAPYVTWECMNGNNYFWGHYCNDRMAAERDLLNRANVELERQEQRAGRTPRNKGIYDLIRTIGLQIWYNDTIKVEEA